MGQNSGKELHAKAFGIGGAKATGVSRAEAEELWKEFDEKCNGILDKEEARHMIAKVGNEAIQFASDEIKRLKSGADMQEVQCGQLKRKLEEQDTVIEDAHHLLKEESAFQAVWADFATSGQATISKDEFFAKATQGYDILRQVKRRKSEQNLPAPEEVKIGDQAVTVVKRCVGPVVYIDASEEMKAKGLPSCLAIISESGLISVTGRMGRKPSEANPVPGGIGPETTQCLENLRLAIAACGCTLADLVAVRVYIKDNGGEGGQSEALNKAYADFFTSLPSPPERTDISVTWLADNVSVMIDALAQTRGA